jgi:hypothetical protein
MPKLSDSNYFLPEISALTPFRTLDSGKNKPMLIHGVCKRTGMKTDYVVKYTNGPEMSLRSACCELIASFIAMELDLYVPEPAIIDVSEEFVSTLIDNYEYAKAKKSIGLNFGCKYVLELLPPIFGEQLTSQLFNHAKEIFIFDVLISNPDRRKDKPNMDLHDGKILIYDHEMAFSFIRLFTTNPQPWLLNNNIERPWIENHYLYPKLRQISEQALDAFIDKIAVLDDAFWIKVHETMPKSWLGPDLIKIQDNLNLIIQNKSLFKQELKSILS